MGTNPLEPQPVIYIIEPFGGSIRRQNNNLPHVFYDDAAVTRGDGVFESILVRDGKPVNFKGHFERFARSAKLLELPEPVVASWRDATLQATEDFVRDRGGKTPDAKCTWTYTRGRASTGVPSAWITLSEVPQAVLDQRKNGVKAMTAPRGYSITPNLPDSKEAAPWLAVGAKTINYAANMAALRWARKFDFDEVIYIEPATGQVLEGATSTVVVVKKGGKLRTPIPGIDVLHGTTQKAIFDYAETKGWRCKARDLTVADLVASESVWLVSSTRIATRVKRIDDVKLPAPENEAELRQLFDKALTAAIN
ncbi:aminodeoxychorismate lyase [Corynebacterium sp. S7]